MRDVAREAGVSRMTVSRALRADSPVSQETRERILKVVREMNYVPDQMAGSLSTKRSGFVAALVPSLNNLHFAETIQALTEELEEIGQQILLGHTDYSMEREEQLVEAMLRRRPEALVLSYDGHSDRSVELLTKARIPVIELWERPPRPIGHTIGFSNREAARQMAEALIALGYSNIAFLGEDEDDWTRGAARRAGFVDAMQAAGLSTERIFKHGKPPISIQDGAAVGPVILERFPETDCIFCVSDASAFGVQSSLIAQGLSVPDDIGIAGFGNFEVSRFASPDITTVEVDSRGIGQTAGQLIGELLALDDDAPVIPRHLSVDTRLSFRGSTKKS
ncbi:LacI family DNA-binding transcriptional regulator [Thalassococcus sp. S3]|uniref:LacI family DNA-binding transcriptional regulator n=1 Tax=Thalassococcus sp. S3 TaxID=2017482 RepID=UPI00102420F0|nr:LacI family DNA-binding transcriptional regulator [Thalassococcus sp. S3]QBF34200.1 LacI family transcriptional regulator [Thalassococcus sp. S3]